MLLCLSCICCLNQCGGMREGLKTGLRNSGIFQCRNWESWQSLLTWNVSAIPNDLVIITSASGHQRRNRDRGSNIRLQGHGKKLRKTHFMAHWNSTLPIFVCFSSAVPALAVYLISFCSNCFYFFQIFYNSAYFSNLLPCFKPLLLFCCSSHKPHLVHYINRLSDLTVRTHFFSNISKRTIWCHLHSIKRNRPATEPLGLTDNVHIYPLFLTSNFLHWEWSGLNKTESSSASLVLNTQKLSDFRTWGTFWRNRCFYKHSSSFITTATISYSAPTDSAFSEHNQFWMSGHGLIFSPRRERFQVPSILLSNCAKVSGIHIMDKWPKKFQLNT